MNFIWHKAFSTRKFQIHYLLRCGDNFTGEDLKNPTGPLRFALFVWRKPRMVPYVSDDLQGAIFRIAYSNEKSDH